MTTAASAKQKMVGSFLKNHPESASLILLKKGPEAIQHLIKNYDLQTISNILNILPSPVLSEALLPLEDATVAKVFNELKVVISSKIFRKWVKTGQNLKVESVISKMTPELAKSVKSLIRYSDKSVGALMDPTPFTVTADMTVEEVLKLLNKETNRYSRYVYVLDSDVKLIGAFPFKDAVYASKDLLVSSIMTPNVFSLGPNQLASDAIQDPAWTKWNLIPITSSKNTLLGVLKYEELRDNVTPALREDQKKEDLIKAGEAVGEIFQIGLGAAVSAFRVKGNRP
jgi:Mg/Co/Ni transporter MgtE